MKSLHLLAAIATFNFVVLASPAMANEPHVVVEGDGHHHFKLHIPKGYYLTHDELGKLCHEDKHAIEEHAKQRLHKMDGSHDNHDETVHCDGGHSLETIHDAH